MLISQTPLTVAIPAHPQIVFALADSQSMDGDLSGAIMTGSGSLGGAVGTSLAASSSPATFTVPSGFTPPLNPGTGGLAPYTVNVSGTLEDNSPSRMNVAKAGITAILNSFMEYADFALMDYQTSNLGEYSTWVYYMSPASGDFTFTANPAGSDYVANPCYNADVTQTDAYSESCAALQTDFGAASGVITQPYMLIGASSDDPLINDVFYQQSSYQPPVCVDGVPDPLDPYTTFGLGEYEAGDVAEFYGVQWGMTGYNFACAPGMLPTNAGYVPFSSQVMQAMRGFGYDATTQSPTTGTLLVPMQSSGNAPTAATVAAALGAFTPYLQPETSDPSTTEIKSVAEQSPIAGLVKGAALYLTNGNPPSSNACAPAQYVVLVTDGLPTEDLSGNSWPPLGTAAAVGYGITATFNANGSLSSTNDGALQDAITQIADAEASGVKTYVIGLGAGVNPANNSLAAQTLTAMAVAGGTGNYFAADSPTDLTGDMQVILAQILRAIRSTSSATVNTTGLNSSSMAFQPSFNTSDVDQDWTGDVKAYPINPGTGSVETGTLDWSAQAQLDSETAGNGWNNRIIATWDPVAGGAIPFEWSGGTPSSGIAVSTVLGQELETNAADPNGQDALDYLRGDSQLSIANGGAYRNRTHILADIVDSAPVYVGPAIGPYQSSSYYAFEQANANREPVLYVGANDGMLHALSAATGRELFAYIPSGVFSNLIQLTNPYYNEDHLFYVDGSPQVGDVQFDNQTWHTLLVGSERGGGNSIFALDVTDPASIANETDLATKVLWDFSDPNMGLGYSTPAIAQTAAGSGTNNLGFTIFFGNGYNSPSQTPYLYALDPRTGTSLPGTPINLCAAVPSACNTSLPNGLSSVSVVNDLGGVGAPATTVYAGDLQGNVWRVNISDPNPLNWVVSLLFQARDPSGTPQPITTTPAISLNPDFPRLPGTMVYVGTGQLLGAPDLSSTQIQTMYGVYDSGSNAGTFTRANLTQQPLTASVVSGQTLRFVSGSEIALPSQNGWYVDFDIVNPANNAQTDVGERIVSDPRLVGGSLSVISVIPSPYSTTAMTASPRSQAVLASASRPHETLPGRAREVATSADATVQVSAGLGPDGFGPQAAGSLALDRGVYYAWDSKVRLWPVGLGVNPPPTLVSISVSPVDPTITAGQTESFIATGTYSDGSTQNLTDQVGWTSSDTGIATINSQGLASSSSAGSTSITATLSGISGSTTLTVNAAPPPPPPPTLVSITVTPANQTIDVGQTQQYTATGTYSDGSTLNLTAQVTWSSSDTGVATIASGGLASGVAAGSTTVTATLSSVSGSTTLTVVTPPPPPPPPTLESIVVTPANPTIDVGAMQAFTATAHYSDGSTQNVTSSATWSSSDTAVATIASGGVATGVAVGTSTITATLSGISGSTTLTVQTPPPPPTLVSITVTPTTTIYVGGTQQFTATGNYSNGSTQNLTSSVTWSSSMTAIATISSGGRATGVAAGSTTITATSGAISGSATLTVETPPPPPVLLSISVTPANPTVDVGQNEGFTATGHYSNGSTQNLTSSASWSSSNTGVATIASGGVASSIAVGTTTIVASSGTVSGSTTLTVVTTPPPPPPPVCPGGDVSYLMEFNFAGGAFNNPVFNYLGPGAITSSIIPANGVLLGGVYASAPVYNTYSAGGYGTGGTVGFVTLSNGNIASFFQLSLRQQRYSWWEIR
ncbi:MAG TPA: PilC/PilY family type IV pilus protein [Steroidobacteraceae bacterium]|nr:PilC/PilY family type IV pilus protein [Steroidobacteraceae bacterium]